MRKFAACSFSSNDQKSDSLISNNNTGSPSSTTAHYSSQKKVIMNSYKTLFFIRREKIDNDTNKCPIYLRLTINTRTEISLGLSVDISKWDSRRQCIKGNSPEVKSLNESLKDIEVRLRNVYNEMYRNGEAITSKSLKERFLGTARPQKTIAELFEFYLKQLKSKVGQDFSPATLKKYEYCRNHLINFVWKSKEESDFPLTQIDYLFIKQFQQYLREASVFENQSGEIVIKKANEHNSTLKYLKMFKTVLNEGVAYNWIKTNPFASFKEKFKEVDQVVLHTDELKAILCKEIQNERLSIVRDLFVFSCFTGFAYIDYQKLLRDDVSFDLKGRKWIIIPRTKSKTPSKVPLLPIAVQIIKKYESHPICLNKGTLLPVLSNQKLNSYLKELADISGLSKKLTTHVGRRTFSSVAINHNVPAETIIKVIGHKNFKHLHLYARVNEDKIVYDLEEMKKAFGDYQYPDLPDSNLKIA